jgi:hypothetical protein
MDLGREAALAPPITILINRHHNKLDLEGPAQINLETTMRDKGHKMISIDITQVMIRAKSRRRTFSRIIGVTFGMDPVGNNNNQISNHSNPNKIKTSIEPRPTLNTVNIKEEAINRHHPLLRGEDLPIVVISMRNIAMKEDRVRVPLTKIVRKQAKRRLKKMSITGSFIKNITSNKGASSRQVTRIPNTLTKIATLINSKKIVSRKSLSPRPIKSMNPRKTQSFTS